VVIRLGILSQLFQTRVSAILQPLDLTYNQLTVLSHLERLGRQQTIGELAEAIEMNQPGVTKLVKRLEDGGLVAVAAGADDRRRRLVSITPAGAERMGNAMMTLFPDVAGWFDSWADEDVDQLGRLVGRLVGWLDENRLAP
jgi:DNA-binding MarR family transcriptional regulator